MSVFGRYSFGVYQLESVRYISRHSFPFQSENSYVSIVTACFCFIWSHPFFDNTNLSEYTATNRCYWLFCVKKYAFFTFVDKDMFSSKIAVRAMRGKIFYMGRQCPPCAPLASCLPSCTSQSSVFSFVHMQLVFCYVWVLLLCSCFSSNVLGFCQYEVVSPCLKWLLPVSSGFF